MLKIYLPRISLVLFIILGANISYAQDTLAKKQDTLVNKFPRAVLVQLRSEHNRMEALNNQKKYDAIEGLEEDAINVASRMKADFNDNFNFCPVYYYMDTNLDLLKSRVFKDILFNADGTPATNIVISDTSRDYLIVFYGYPTPQSRLSDVVIDSFAYRYNSGEPLGKGLIINNYKFQQVSFLYKLDYENLAFRLRKANKKYIYVSKKYDMEYFPFAEVFNKKLQTRQEKIRISHHRGEDPNDKLLH